MPEETKICYYIGDEPTPYVSKINIPQDVITLGDFKAAIKKPNFKYFFRSTDADFGVVKEEITNDDAKLPLHENRIVAWLVAPELDTVSNSSSAGIRAINQDAQDESANSLRSLQNRSNASHQHSDTESLISMHRGLHRNYGYAKYGSQSTLVSSDIDATSWDSRDDMSEYSSFSEMTTSTRHKPRQKKRQLKKRRPRPSSDTTSTYSSSITDSSMSLNILSVTLNMEKYNFLGISIVGQSNDKGDGGIYIGSIMKGGAVAADGRIEPGDMLLQVNDVNFENMTNEDAVHVLRNIVHKTRPIILTVAKCWDPNPETSYFTIPKDEPVRPIDPAAWANHTMAARGGSPSYALHQCETGSDTLGSSLPESDRYDVSLSTLTDMAVVVKTMKMPDSGLDVKTRMWLKITIPNAFIGSDLVDWLNQKVDGLGERREARKYASNLLKAGYIRHTVNKITFSEQCYYVFGDYSGSSLHREFTTLSLGDSNSDRDSDTLGPLPTHSGGMPHWNVHPPEGAPGFASFNQYTSSHQPPHLNVGSRLDGGDRGSNMFLDYTPPPAYSGIAEHQSDVDTISLRSSKSVIHRPPSELSMSRQHLATFGANGSAGSGSDQASESRYSNHSGGERYHSGGERSASRSSGTNSKRSHSGSEKSLENLASQVNFRARPASYSSLPRHHYLPQSTSTSRPHTTRGMQRPVEDVPADLSGSRQSFQRAMNNPCDMFVDVM